MQIEHDTELFSSVHNATCPKGVPPAAYDLPLVPIDVDGPLVKEYRRVVLAKLSPSGAAADEPRLREIATELIDAFIERGSCDLSQELLTPLPGNLSRRQRCDTAHPTGSAVLPSLTAETGTTAVRREQLLRG